MLSEARRLLRAESKHPYPRRKSTSTIPAVERLYYVYIMSSLSGTLYIGFTGNLLQRNSRHKIHLFDGFAAKYNCDRLVWYEAHADPGGGIRREKQLKGWRREKKIALIRKMNPSWKDLGKEWHVEIERKWREWEERFGPVPQAPFRG